MPRLDGAQAETSSTRECPASPGSDQKRGVKGVERFGSGDRIGRRDESGERAARDDRRLREDRLGGLKCRSLRRSWGALEPRAALTAPSGRGIFRSALAAACVSRSAMRSVGGGRRMHVERSGAAGDRRGGRDREEERRAQEQDDTEMRHPVSIREARPGGRPAGFRLLRSRSRPSSVRTTSADYNRREERSS